jgi:hypothetical protein
MFPRLQQSGARLDGGIGCRIGVGTGDCIGIHRCVRARGEREAKHNDPYTLHEGISPLDSRLIPKGAEEKRFSRLDANAGACFPHSLCRMIEDQAPGGNPENFLHEERDRPCPPSSGRPGQGSVSIRTRSSFQSREVNLIAFLDP